jgi:hypothetical protein
MRRKNPHIGTYLPNQGELDRIIPFGTFLINRELATQCVSFPFFIYCDSLTHLTLALPANPREETPTS